MRNLNKKGTDKIISVYWFTILFIVAGAIVYMAAIFYGEPYDARETEANVLINQIAGCISQGGRLNDSWSEINSDNFLEKCHLTFNVEDFKGWSNDQHYVKISYSNFNIDSGVQDNWKELVSKGNINLKDNCEKKSNNLPVCVERNFYVLDAGNNPYVIKILSIVRKTEKNA